MSIVARTSMIFGVDISLSESEARALDALVGYGDDAFIKKFYETLGIAYMGPHEAGLRSLFKRLREDMPPQLRRIDQARGVWNGKEAP